LRFIARLVKNTDGPAAAAISNAMRFPERHELVGRNNVIDDADGVPTASLTGE
jgi:hypothetical protein